MSIIDSPLSSINSSPCFAGQTAFNLWKHKCGFLVNYPYFLWRLDLCPYISLRAFFQLSVMEYNGYGVGSVESQLVMFLLLFFVCNAIS